MKNKMKKVVTEISVAPILLQRRKNLKIKHQKLFRRKPNVRRMLLAISLLQRLKSKNAKFPKWSKKSKKKSLKRKKTLSQSHKNKKILKKKRVSSSRVSTHGVFFNVEAEPVKKLSKKEQKKKEQEEFEAIMNEIAE